jgi:PPE-repeat protein
MTARRENMDFETLPPEVNSGRMYSGPGPATLLAASAQWAELAAEMHLAATSCESVAGALIAESWTGPSSAAMAAAVFPYAGWVRTVATQCEDVAAKATAAATAYELAHAMTVPPSIIAANRVRFAALVASNLLGQNTPAIMVAESEYSEMWAQDTVAMYGYAASSANAVRLSAFTPPPHATDPGGPTDQTGTAAASGATTALGAQAPLASSGISSSLTTLSQMTKTSTHSVSTGTGSGTQAASQLANTMARLVDVGNTAPEIGTEALNFGSDGFGLSTDVSGFALDLAGSGLELVGGDSLLGAEEAIPAELGTLESIDPLGALADPWSAGLSSEPTAGLGQAAQLGTLSVPPGWANALSADAGHPGPHAASPPGHHGSSHHASHRHTTNPAAGGMVGRDAAGGAHRVGVRSSLVPRSPIGG